MPSRYFPLRYFFFYAQTGPSVRFDFPDQQNYVLWCSVMIFLTGLKLNGLFRQVLTPQFCWQMFLIKHNMTVAVCGLC